MKNRVYKAVAALCAVFLVVACFVPMMGVKAAAASSWSVNIYNLDGSVLYGTVSIGLVDSAESIIVGGAQVINGWLRNQLIFTYKNSSGSYESYEWIYPGADDLLGFKVKLGSTWYEYGIGEAFRGEEFYTAKVDAVYLITGEGREEERHMTLLEKLAAIPERLLSVLANPLGAIKSAVDGLSNFFIDLADKIVDLTRKVNAGFNDLGMSIYHLFFPEGSDDELGAGSGEVNGALDNVQDFEDDYLGSIQDGMGYLSDDVNIGFLAPTFAFIGGRISTVWDNFGDYKVVFLLPVFVGLFFVLARFNPRSLQVRERPVDRRDK